MNSSLRIIVCSIALVCVGFLANDSKSQPPALESASVWWLTSPEDENDNGHRGGYVFEALEMHRSSAPSYYDSHKTSNGNNMFDHGHAVLDWTSGTSSLTVYQNNPDVRIVQVSRNQVEEFHTEYYANHTIDAGTATTTYNCHGHSTGLGFWVDPYSDGMGIVLGDDWEPYWYPTLAIYEDYDHSVSYVYTSVGCSPGFWTTTEKSGCGPTMTLVSFTNPVAGMDKYRPK